MKPRNYECRKCEKINQITTPWGMFITPHIGWRKWLKCEHCGAKRHFQRRVFKPELKLLESVHVWEQRYQEAVDSFNIQKDTIDQLKAERDFAKDALIGECMLTSCSRQSEIEKETAKRIFADIDAITYEYMNNEEYSMGDMIYDIDGIREKYIGEAHYADKESME